MQSLPATDCLVVGIQANNPPQGGLLASGAILSVRGFTLIELIVTMTIVGILAVTVIPRWSGSSEFNERAFRDRVVAALRYAQKSAIATRRTTCAIFAASPASVSFRISGSNGAADCSVGGALVGMEGNALVVTAGSGVSFSALPAAIVFDAAGRPTSGATINISALSASQSITVEAETGYVH